MKERLMTVAQLIERLENDYAFACEAGPLKNCVEWQQLKEDVKDLREEIALAGVEGSPPGIPTLMDRLQQERDVAVRGWEGAAADRDRALAQVQTLREALRVIHTTVRGDEKSNCWTIRKWLDKRGVFNGDLSSSKRLIEAACLAALSPKEPR